MSKQCKVFNFDIKQVGPEEDRVLRFVGSDETPDRDNDVIEVAGWKLDNYLKNPVFMWAHSYDEPPIGKAVNVTIDAMTKKLLFDVKFPSAETYPFADTVYKLYKEGFLSATSVGFRGIKHKTRDEDEVLNLPEWRRGRRYMEQELLELSAVPVPCNPNALVEVRSKGFKGEDVDKVFTEELKEVDLLIDSNTKEVFVTENGEKAAKVKIASEYFERLMEPLDQKSGASVSAKNRELLAAIHLGFDDGTKKLKEFLDAVMPVDHDDMPLTPGDMPMISAMRTAELDEIKQALEDIKSQVLLLSQKDAPKEINLDAIEYTPPAKKDAVNDELKIEPEELKNLIADIVKEQIATIN